MRLRLLTGYRLLIMIIFCLGVVTPNSTFACSMYKITLGNKTMVGCNEDAWRTTSRIWFENSTENHQLGAAFTGSRSVGPDHFAPQSGMNEAGLVFSRLTAFHPVEENYPDKGKKPITQPVHYLKDILHTCRTIGDVQEYIGQYDHSSFINDVFIYVDKSGEYLIVEPYKLITGDDPTYVLANFCPSITRETDARKQQRFNQGKEFIARHGTDTTLRYCTALSDTMHVCRSRNGDGTLLTSIWDSQAETVHLYFYHKYDQSVQFNIAEELTRGDHILEIPAMFPENSEFERLGNYITPFNTPPLRIGLVLLGGFFFLSSLLFGFSLRNRDQAFYLLKLFLAVLGIIMTCYLFVLATNINIYYFDAPYEGYHSPWVSLSSYTPFLLLLATVPLVIFNYRVIREKVWSRVPKWLFTLNTLAYAGLLGCFGYWGLFEVY